MVVKPPYVPYTGESAVTNVCIGSQHPERQRVLEELRRQHPNMRFEEERAGPLMRSVGPRPPEATTGNAAVDDAVRAANSATPSSGCNGTTIRARPATP